MQETVVLIQVRLYNHNKNIFIPHNRHQMQLNLSFHSTKRSCWRWRSSLQSLYYFRTNYYWSNYWVLKKYSTKKWRRSKFLLQTLF